MLTVQYAKLLRNVAITGLLAGSAAVHGSVLLSVELVAETGSSSAQYYLAFPSLRDFNAGDPDLGVNRQVIIQSPDGNHQGYLNNPEGWGSSSTHIGSVEDLSDGLTGTWRLTDYVGTEQEKEYQFEVDLGSLLSGGIPFTRIASPLHGGLVHPDNPTFTWNGPTDFESQSVTLYRRNPDGSYGGPVASEFFAGAEIESWTPGVTLDDGGLYTIRVTKSRNVGFDGFIGTPVDSEGNTWEPGWADAYATVQSATQIEFTADSGTTAVPEPRAVLGGVICLAWAGGRWLRRRRGAPRENGR